MIDKRELLEKARQKKLSLMMVDKDYVLGWLLHGFAKHRGLIFKGGTALSKVYFPGIWRLSEDLDFSLIKGRLQDLRDSAGKILAEVKKKAGIEFILKSSHINPDYLQLKIQCNGLTGRNWVKVDIIPNDLVDKPATKTIPQDYSDYVPFEVKVESLAEIFASKLRAAIERKKCRDFFDLWKLSQTDIDSHKIKQVFEKKLAVRNLEFQGLGQIFPDDLHDTLKPYWERELGRLVNPLPEMTEVLTSLRGFLEFL